MQRNTNTTTNILLAIIAIALVIVIIVVLKKDKKEILVEETNIPTQEVVPEIEVPAATSTPKLVTPPAPGTFSETSVKDFTSSYNPSNRTFTITAQVARNFFFEANSPVALYDQDGNLIEMRGATLTNDSYSTGNQYLPLTFTFTLPLTESPDQQFVVRIIQDNAKDDSTPLYWGTVIGTK